MTYTEYKATDPIRCPHCDMLQDDVAEDFVITGREEVFVIDLCYDCDQNFSVRRNPETGMYEVKP